MNLWTEVSPQGSNVWVMPREMYDTVCLCAVNKSSTDVFVEVDYTDSRGAMPMVSGADASGGIFAPVAAAAEAGPQQQQHSTQKTCRSFLAAKQSTVIAVFRPETPFLPMQCSYRCYLVAVAKKEDVAAVDAEGAKLLLNSAQQSAEVENWLRSRRK